MATPWSTDEARPGGHRDAVHIVEGDARSRVGEKRRTAARQEAQDERPVVSFLQYPGYPPCAGDTRLVRYRMAAFVHRDPPEWQRMAVLRVDPARRDTVTERIFRRRRHPRRGLARADHRDAAIAARGVPLSGDDDIPALERDRPSDEIVRICSGERGAEDIDRHLF